MYANVQIMWNDIPLAYAPIYKELFNSRNTRMSQKYLYPTYHEAFPESEYMLLNIISLKAGLENSTRPLVFTSASGCRASENFDISSEN